MGNAMDKGLFGMKMDRRRVKELTRMGKKTGIGPTGMRMDRRRVKEPTGKENLIGN